jgi:tetratricopeptide (TPR) repeat protein
MLFDLQSPRRRAAVKVIYATLAVLLGGGLLFFGIGSDATGGLLDAVGLRDSENNASDIYSQEIETAQAALKRNPDNEAARLDLVSLYIQRGNQQLQVDQQTGQSTATPEASTSYNLAADQWDIYLKGNPKNPDSGLALQLANSFFLMAQSSTSASDARIDVDNAAEAQQVAADQNPTVGNLNSLAVYLLYAGKFGEAQAVIARALAKAPAADRKDLQKQFDQVEKSAKAFEKQVATESKTQSQSGGSGAGGSNPLSGGGLGSSPLGGP